jgi:hypothetical protein
MFCSYCGTELPHDAGFCWKCGKKTQIKQNTSHDKKNDNVAQSPLDKKSLKCPICGGSDTIQSIESLVLSNTINTRYSGRSSGSGRIQGSSSEFNYGSHINGSSTTQSTLAKLLDFPIKIQPNESAYQNITVISTLAVVLVAVFLIYNNFSNSPGESICGGYIYLWIVAIISIIFRKKISNGTLKTVKEKQMKWETALKYWKQLYYCSRDGIIFDSQSDKKILISELNIATWHSFLFSA